MPTHAACTTTRRSLSPEPASPRPPTAPWLVSVRISPISLRRYGGLLFAARRDARVRLRSPCDGQDKRRYVLSLNMHQSRTRFSHQKAPRRSTRPGFLSRPVPLPRAERFPHRQRYSSLGLQARSGGQHEAGQTGAKTAGGGSG